MSVDGCCALFRPLEEILHCVTKTGNRLAIVNALAFGQPRSVGCLNLPRHFGIALFGAPPEKVRAFQIPESSLYVTACCN
jgi:hypothetical protein